MLLILNFLRLWKGTNLISAKTHYRFLNDERNVGLRTPALTICVEDLPGGLCIDSLVGNPYLHLREIRAIMVK